MNEEGKKNQDEVDISSVEIRSEEVQEIMGFIPNWIIRWGITLFFVVIMMFLMGSWLFKYPDVIQSTIVVTTEIPPAAIVARTNGKIQRLFVQNNQKVTAGEYIAMLENATNYFHLFELKEKLDTLKSISPHYDTSDSMLLNNKNYSLGELQPGYSVFLKSYQDYQYFIQLDYHNKKIESINQQVTRHKSLYEGMVRQTAIMDQEFKLSQEQYKRASTLLKDGVISKNELESAESNFLQKEYALESARSNMANQKIQLAQLEQSILDLKLEYKEQKKRLELALNQAFENLTGQIAQWEQNYLLKTPISGVVAFTKYWSINQNVKIGDTVFTIVPNDAGKMVGKVVLPIRGSGKVKIGQNVNIKFFNYPHVDYGMVRGVIKSKSLVTSDNNYALEVDLPEGLKTSYGEVLPFHQEMQGTAEIITEDIRLMERIFKPIKSILERM